MEKDKKVKITKIKPKSAVIASTSKSSECGTNDSCCGSDNGGVKASAKEHWITGEICTTAGSIPQVSTTLTGKDAFGTLKVRLGIGRMDYKVNPGIYAVGTPDKSSPVLVTANYKLTFDSLRKQFVGLNAWILVLDTKGVNVWCAAGKGTFGTKELISRIAKTKLSQVVDHKTIILPQLGAPGVRAHEITRLTGFKVVYGPVRAEDIKEFLARGMKVSDDMREVKFGIKARAVLTPIEFISTYKIAMLVFGIMFLLNLVAVNPFGIIDFYALVGALFAGAVLTPILLPYIPVRAFAAKGWIVGLLWAVAVNVINGWPAMPVYGILKTIAYILILPAISSYYGMNFTGSSTYTSFSGVIKEMKAAVPVIIISIALGVILLLVNSFIMI